MSNPASNPCSPTDLIAKPRTRILEIMAISPDEDHLRIPRVMMAIDSSEVGDGATPPTPNADIQQHLITRSLSSVSTMSARH
ncbi:hypothetical protein ACRE_080870 [Hapsidospora chrysogenum ATCC 11550]|uniref:Uncharacterized protein n=1 Tax=Hapsidospora chrysogenum (strain ATCC 11550 / CBS 779.69 / DSM 880 / IAM 14645 / JCM 23072 / IMI 49137) TaxID=857340 RepID=A0A086SVR7_HAPC1|nr:hypothetical protein ACRE_080870 [Hapsidospora chrysogenum ATCC 11550]